MKLHILPSCVLGELAYGHETSEVGHNAISMGKPDPPKQADTGRIASPLFIWEKTIRDHRETGSRDLLEG